MTSVKPNLKAAKPYNGTAPVTAYEAQVAEVRKQIDAIFAEAGLPAPHWSEYDTNTSVSVSLPALLALTGKAT